MSSQNFNMKSYMKGALLLTIAALIVKVLSAVYRVPFQNLVGDQGFYVYQQVYPFVAIFVTWTASGVAVAISKMLAELDAQSSDNLSHRQSILRVIFQYLTVLSLVFFCALFFGAPLLANIMGDELLARPMQIGAIVTLFMPILAIFKGSFQSRGVMNPIAYSQVFEQTIRVSVILIGTVIIMSTTQSIYGAGTMAIFGTVVGELAGIVLLYYFMRKEGMFVQVAPIKLAKWPIIKEITLFSLSVSMSSLLLLTFQLIDSFTIFSSLLKAGIDYDSAQIMKGIYDRGQPLVQLGLVIASSLALAIVPLVAFKSKSKTGRGAKPFINLTYRATLVFAVAASFGLMFVMPYVNQALFKEDVFSSILSIYALQTIPLAIIITMTAILQGYSKLFVPAIFIVISCGIKLLGNILFIPTFELDGAVLTSNISLFGCAIAIIIYVRKILQTSLAPLTYYIKLISAVILMGIAIKGTSLLMGMLIVTSEISRVSAVLYCIICVSVGAFVFMTAVAKMRVLKEKEWFLIPLGRRMAAYQLLLNRKRK
jgi:O-antigen/teichoic acid export membrane protein